MSDPKNLNSRDPSPAKPDQDDGIAYMNSQKKGIVALLVVLITLVMGVLSFISVRFFFGGNEDGWVCVQGSWIAHGNPSSAKPTKPCGE